MNKYLLKVKKPIIYIPTAILLIVVVFLVYKTSTKQETIIPIPISTSTPSVLISGKVRAMQDAELSVQKTGRVTSINKNVGDKVFKGEIILSTEAGELLATLQKEQAKLDELFSGSRPEEIAIAKKKLENAIVEKDSAFLNIKKYLQSSYASLDDAFRNKIDQFIVNPTSVGAKIDLPVTNVELSKSVAYERYLFESKLNTLKNLLSSPLNNEVLRVYKEGLESAIAFLNNFAIIINSITSNSSYPQTTLSVWKADVAGARNSVINSYQELTDAHVNYINKEKEVLIATEELSIKEKKGSDIEIKIQQAIVAGIRAQIDNTLIRAPFDGILTRQDARVGQTLQTGDNIVAVISEGQYQIEAYVPEINVSKIDIASKAVVTLDAFGPNIKFNAKVVSVDLSEKNIDGVPSYKVRLVFEEFDSKIKTGMTANVSISVKDHDAN